MQKCSVNCKAWYEPQGTTTGFAGGCFILKDIMLQPPSGFLTDFSYYDDLDFQNFLFSYAVLNKTLELFFE